MSFRLVLIPALSIFSAAAVATTTINAANCASNHQLPENTAPRPHRHTLAAKYRVPIGDLK